MKSPRQKTVKKLDVAFSKFIRKRDTDNGYGRCCSCDKLIPYENGDAGHFINRRWYGTRWREDNVHFQCIACNRFDEGNAAGYALFMLGKYGKTHVEFLKAMSHESAKFTVVEMELMIVDYKSRT